MSEVRVLTWNLFHGRDAPPDPFLDTRRSRWLRATERGETHAQLNRDLSREFITTLAEAGWDIALLQECPPRWLRRLTRDCDAEAHRVLTSRNRLRPLSGWLATLNPDLIGSSEGGSNTTLVRRRFAAAAERRSLVLTRRPERRVMAFTRLDNGLCIANLHASTDERQAAIELLLAAEGAVGWAGPDPLVLGGDLNVRPRSSGVFDELADRYGFSGPTDRGSIDHLLARGMKTARRPRPWPAEARDVERRGLRVRLSDHAPVEARFRLAGPR